MKPFLWVPVCLLPALTSHPVLETFPTACSALCSVNGAWLRPAASVAVPLHPGDSWPVQSLLISPARSQLKATQNQGRTAPLHGAAGCSQTTDSDRYHFAYRSNEKPMTSLNLRQYRIKWRFFWHKPLCSKDPSINIRWIVSFKVSMFLDVCFYSHRTGGNRTCSF